jgi:hypothetical protein
LFPLFAGIGLAIGCIVPSIFELTQELHQRSRHEGLEMAATIAIGATVLLCSGIILGRRNVSSLPATETGPRKHQFGLRAVFAVTTVTAIVLAIAKLLDSHWTNSIVMALAFAIVGWSISGGWPIQSRVGALLASLFLPFTWMVAFNVPFGHTSGLAVNIPIGPGILAAELLRGFANMSVDEAGNLAFGFVLLQLLVGAWLAQRGGAGFIGFAVLVLASSTLSSLVFHVLYRA